MGKTAISEHSSALSQCGGCPAWLKAQGLDNPSLAIDVVSEPQLEEISVFYPSHASVTTFQAPKDLRGGMSIVYHHRDGIPPTDRVSFSCSSTGSSLPVAERFLTVLPTAGSSSPTPTSSLKLRRFD